MQIDKKSFVITLFKSFLMMPTKITGKYLVFMFKVFIKLR